MYYIYACIMCLMLYDVICIKIWIIVSTSSALPVIERIRAHCRSWRLRSPSIEREWADCEWIWMTPNCGCEPRPEQYSTLTGALGQFLYCWPWWSESLDHSKGFQGLGTLSRFQDIILVCWFSVHTSIRHALMSYNTYIYTLMYNDIVAYGICCLFFHWFCWFM